MLQTRPVAASLSRAGGRPGLLLPPRAMRSVTVGPRASEQQQQQQQREAPRRRRPVLAAAAAAAVLAPPPPAASADDAKQQQQRRARAAACAAWIVAAAQRQPALRLALALAVAASRAVSAARDALAAAVPPPPTADDRARDPQRAARALRRRLTAARFGVRAMAVVALPLARAGAESLSAVYARTFEKAAFGFAKMYLFCLFMRVLLSWFPGIDWNVQPWAFLRLITEPYLSIYRGILPPLFGQLDFTPLFGFLILQDVVEIMSPNYTGGLHSAEDSSVWTTSDALCYFDGL